MTSIIFGQNSVSLCPASFCIPRPNLLVTPDILISYFCIPVPYDEKLRELHKRLDNSIKVQITAYLDVQESAELCMIFVLRIPVQNLGRLRRLKGEMDISRSSRSRIFSLPLHTHSLSQTVLKQGRVLVRFQRLKLTKRLQKQ